MWDVLPVADLVTQPYGCVTNVQEWRTPQCISGYRHTGIDLGAKAGGWTIYRAPVKATRAGTVVRVGYPNGLGPNAVCLYIGSNTWIWYGHLDSASVAVGQAVTVGQEIGKLGTKGNSTAPHLHLEVRIDGPLQNADRTIDPTPYLNFGGYEMIHVSVFWAAVRTWYAVYEHRSVEDNNLTNQEIQSWVNQVNGDGGNLDAIEQAFIDGSKKSGNYKLGAGAGLSGQTAIVTFK